MNTILHVIQNLDTHILLFIQNHLRSAGLTPLVAAFTRLGNRGLLWIVISVILLFPKRTRRAGILSLVALAVTYLVVDLWLKDAVLRVRPYDAVSGLSSLIGSASGGSFPSGHAASSFASAVAIFRNSRRRLGVPCVILAFLMASSRLYVGVHYPSDVLCGAVIGALIGLVISLLFGKRKRSGRKKRAVVGKRAAGG